MLGGRSMALQRLAAMELIVSVVVLAGYIYAYHASVDSMEKQYMQYMAKYFEQSNELIAELDDKDFADASGQEELTQWMETVLQESLPVSEAADGKYYSSSCTITGIDMALSVVADMVDLEVAERIAQKLGHAWDAEDENVYQ